jgi:hypothetical protein
LRPTVPEVRLARDGVAFSQHNARYADKSPFNRIDDSMDLVALAERTLDRQLELVRTADSKVAPVFAVDAAMLSVLGVRLPAFQSFTPGAAVAWGLAAAALLISLVFLGMVAFPRLEGPKESLVFFGTAAKMEAETYVTRLLSSDAGALSRDIALQAHRNAEIASDKFSHLRLASVFMFAALPLWLLALVLTRHIAS